MKSVIRSICWTAPAAMMILTTAQAASPVQAMVELTIGGQRIEGLPIDWDETAIKLLGRDGRLWQFVPEDVSAFHKTADRFQGYNASELRAVLLRELGGDYEVSGTGHYMVAHPRGQRDRWAERFEDLYRTFVQYFSVRGVALREPPCLLVGVVCRNGEEFRRHNAQAHGPTHRGVLGYYSSETNRIWLYDVGGGNANAAGWKQNAATVVHEATHQMAFNTGVHNRYSHTPLWVAEGLATNFEAIGSSDGRGGASPRDRLNRQRHRDFVERVAPQHKSELLSGMIASDRIFQTAPAAGYAEAWALSFYLIETQPRKYAEYLVRTSARPPFSDYASRQRVDDFVAVFGGDWRMLEARLLRFFDELK